MKKFTLSLILFSLLFLAYDKGFLIIADLSAKAEIDKRLEDLINGRINKDIIIVGSSTGSRDIIAGQLEAATDLSVFNLCYPGSNVEFHEFIVRTLAEFNRPPKLLILAVDDEKELLADPTTTFRNDRMYPLVKYKYIRDELVNRGEKDWFFSRFLVLYQLNKSNFDLRKKKFTPLDTILDCGSMPISWQREGREWIYETEEKPYQQENELPEKVLAFKRIIETCELNNIRILVVFPPVFKKHSLSFERRIRQLAGNKTYYYVYDTDNPIYSQMKYYYDETHLLQNGAGVFTDEIAVYIDSVKGSIISVSPKNESH
jgi:hypothetical protein